MPAWGSGWYTGSPIDQSLGQFYAISLDSIREWRVARKVRLVDIGLPVQEGCKLVPPLIGVFVIIDEHQERCFLAAHSADVGVDVSPAGEQSDQISGS